MSDNVLQLPFTDNYIQNRIIRLSKEIAHSEEDWIDPLISAMLKQLEGTVDYEDDNHIQQVYNYLYAALIEYRLFSGRIKIDY